jgi:hypothetical protein
LHYSHFHDLIEINHQTRKRPCLFCPPKKRKNTMTTENHTFADSINAICETYKQDPACLTKHDLNNLETLKRDANWLLSESYRRPMNSPRHHQAFDRVHSRLRNLEKKCADYHCQKKWRDALLRQEKFNPNHKPAGSPDGGQFDFAPGGGGSGGGSGGSAPAGDGNGRDTSLSAGKLPSVKPSADSGSPEPGGYNVPFKPLKVGTAVSHAKENILDPDKYPHGNQRCGVHVREAVEAGTGATLPRPKSGAAKDFGKPLEHIGFVPIVTTKKGADYHSGNGYTPEEGDVAVIQGTSKSPSGHTAIYTGKDENGKEVWVSDFKQRTFWPGPVYRDEKPSYTIYRHQNRIPVD